MEPKSKVYKIGELAELTSSTTRTLRYYEELGLVSAVRNSSGQRLYDESSLERLHLINELKSGGFTLQEVKNFFDGWREPSSGAKASSATIGLVQRKLAEIGELQKRLTRLHDELRGMVGFLGNCQNCDEKPSLEGCESCDRHSQEPLHGVLRNILSSSDGKVAGKGSE